MSDPTPPKPRFPLAAALFPGILPAEGCTEPTEYAPDSWLLSFKQHADPAVYLGLFSSCRGGRDYTLQTANTATLRLQPGSAQSDEAWQRTLDAARQALMVRGALSTRLVLLGYEPDLNSPDSQQQTTARLSGIPQQLEGAGSGVTELTVTHSGLLPHTFLTTAASAFPHLHTLSVDQCTCPLPPPAQWPQLRRLQVTIPPPCYNTHSGVWEEHPTTLAVFQSIAAHLPQLTSLDFSRQPERDDVDPSLPWEQLFTAGSTSHTLTHLTTNCTLTDELVPMLLSHTPALSQLFVSFVSI